MTEETSTGTDRAGELRGKLVDELCEWEPFRVAAVEDAMRSVPRHLFLPGVSLDEAYSHDNTVTHRDSEGVAVSSASQPGLVGAMLDYWLAAHYGLCRLLTRSQDHGLVAPVYGWGSMAVLDQETLAYLTKRSVGEIGESELGVCAYGPASEKLID